MREQWAEFEDHVNELLDLISTPGSGNQFHSPGDGFSRTGRYPILVDAKYTTALSYSVHVRDWQQGRDTAVMEGKKFVMPIRLHPGGANGRVDLAVISLDDLAELLAGWHG